MDRIRMRPLTRDDLSEVCALHNRAEAHDGVLRVVELAELAETLDDERVVLATDTRAALGGDSDEIVGEVHTYHLPSDVRAERCYVFGYVDPAWRGRGVGRTLLAWGVERATDQLLASGGDLPKFVRVEAFDTMSAAHRLYARMGFTPIRWFEDLLRPLDDLPTWVPPQVSALVSPPGFAIVPWPEGRDDEIRMEKDLAFADHWGSAPTTPGDWHDRVHGYGSRVDLSWVALDEVTGSVIGHCLNRRFEADDAVVNRCEGWIDSLGTLAGWRGRGVASAMVVASLHAFAAAGLSHAAITVDSDNPSGAARLYRALGFELLLRSTTHEIEVT